MKGREGLEACQGPQLVRDALRALSGRKQKKLEDTRLSYEVGKGPLVVRDQIHPGLGRREPQEREVMIKRVPCQVWDP